MTDIIVGAVIVVIIGLAAAYIIRAKKRGAKCIGCPDDAVCPHRSAGGPGCGCHTDAK